MKRLAILTTISLLTISHFAGATPLQCPPTAYDAGGFCKAQPTGCPYGDSIPLGAACDKVAPQVNQIPQTVESVQYDVNENTDWGK